MEEDISGLRKWAENRCIKATEAKLASKANGKKQRNIEL
jgi:hypothetical protein